MSDIVELKSFYASQLGRTTAHLLARRIEAIWPDLQGLTIAGLGYATPFLDRMGKDAGLAFAIMPGHQGVTAWPKSGDRRVVMAEEDLLPVEDASIDRILVIHALEDARQTRAFLREVWRVLEPGGRALIVVPNRRSVWARSESTPFAHGRPYSPGQLRQVLNDTLLFPVSWSGALYLPPLKARWGRRLLAAAERLMKGRAARFGGVLMVEAEKEMYAALPARERKKASRPAFILAGDRFRRDGA